MSIILAPPAISALFLLRKTSRVLNLLTTGTNHENYILKKVNQEDTKYTNHKKNFYYNKATHAEEMALDKIVKPKSRKIIDVSLLVIRISCGSTCSKYKLCNSRPCAACMYKIKNSVQSGYRVSKIYFSNDNGDIVCYKIRDIIAEKQFVSKYYRLTAIPKKLTNVFVINEVSFT